MKKVTIELEIEDGCLNQNSIPYICDEIRCFTLKPDLDGEDLTDELKSKYAGKKILAVFYGYDYLGDEEAMYSIIGESRRNQYIHEDDILEHHHRYKCDYCGEEFDYSQSLSLHLYLCNDNPANKCCKTCAHFSQGQINTCKKLDSPVYDVVNPPEMADNPIINGKLLKGNHYVYEGYDGGLKEALDKNGGFYPVDLSVTNINCKHWEERK